MTAQRYLTLREAPHYLREHGYPVSFSALRKMCLPSRGEGPPVAGRWGQRLLFAPNALLEWAERRVKAALHHPEIGGASGKSPVEQPHQRFKRPRASRLREDHRR
jgi:hypothetical protein